MIQALICLYSGPRMYDLDLLSAERNSCSMSATVTHSYHILSECVCVCVCLIPSDKLSEGFWWVERGDGGGWKGEERGGGIHILWTICGPALVELPTSITPPPPPPSIPPSLVWSCNNQKPFSLICFLCFFL